MYTLVLKAHVFLAHLLAVQFSVVTRPLSFSFFVCRVNYVIKDTFGYM